jgi:hypothetical protein
MKSQKTILLVLFLSVYLLAQEDTTQSKKREINSIDSSKKTLSLTPTLPPRVLTIKMKDLKEIKNLEKSSFKVIDDTSHFTAEELESGLSEEELDNYKKNKEEIKQLFIPPPSEEETYPTISTIRKILNVAKTAGVIIILILSLL